MFKYDLSIIIVNWNTGHLLLECIESIYATTKGIKYEIIVVDNNSSDNSLELVKSKFTSNKELIIIENRHNKGFASANNQAIKISSGKNILLLNPDTIVNGDVIYNTYKYLDENKQVGVAGCKVLNPDGTLQKACRRMVPTPKDAFFKLFGFSSIFKGNKTFSRYNLNYEDENRFLDVDSVSGAYLMIKMETIEKIGYLDETFFMYGEEMDWCLRAKRAGYGVRYCPVGSIIHFKGESSKQLGLKATYEFYRAMWVFYKKNNRNKYSFLMDVVVILGISLLCLMAIIKNILVPRSRVGSKG